MGCEGENTLLRIMSDGAHAAGKRVGVSIGGWSLSWNFGTVAGDSIQRNNMVNSVIDLVREYELDVIDIDWESPACGEHSPDINGGCVGFMQHYPDDPQNMALMFQELREGLDEQGLTHVTLSTAVMITAIPAYVESFPHLHRILLMTYDMVWVSEGQPSGHHSPLYNDKNALNSVHGSVQKLISLGYPKEQIQIGVPAYGHGWIATGPDINNSNITIAADSHNDPPVEPGVTSATFYDAMLENCKPQWDPTAEASWCVNPATNEMWSYDSPQAIEAKVNYACDHGLAGVAVWDAKQIGAGQPNQAVEYDALVSALMNMCSS